MGTSDGKSAGILVSSEMVASAPSSPLIVTESPSTFTAPPVALSSAPSVAFCARSWQPLTDSASARKTDDEQCGQTRCVSWGLPSKAFLLMCAVAGFPNSAGRDNLELHGGAADSVGSEA